MVIFTTSRVGRPFQNTSTILEDRRACMVKQRNTDPNLRDLDRTNQVIR